MRVKVGAVFAIPINDREFAYGQIVADTKPRCYVIYAIKSSIHPELNKIVSSKILLLAYTVDAFLEKGPWLLLGYAEIPKDIVFPNFLLGVFETKTVVDHYGKHLRRATLKDVKELSYHRSVSPAVFRDAARAIWGELEWDPIDNWMLYQK